MADKPIGLAEVVGAVWSAGGTWRNGLALVDCVAKEAIVSVAEVGFWSGIGGAAGGGGTGCRKGLTGGVVLGSVDIEVEKSELKSAWLEFFGF